MASMETMTNGYAAEIDRHVRVYITAFVTLMALTIVTVAISYLHLPVHLAVSVALFVAAIEGLLVACYLHAPHLREEGDLWGPGADGAVLHRAVAASRPHRP